MKNKIFMILMITILLFTFTSCSQEPEETNEDEKVRVYASIYPVYDFARKIGGDNIQVELLVPPGAEPHSWEPSAKTVANIERSKILLYNGLEMDPWAEKLAGSLKGTEIQTLAVGEIEGIDYIQSDEQEHDHQHEQDHHHGTYDPHIWLDPTIAEKMAEAIKDILIKVDQTNKEDYEKNFGDFKEDLATLDEDYQQNLAHIEKKEFVVAHAAFGYLARRYDLTQVPIAGIAPQVEPSSTKLAEITSLMKEKELTTIFFENLSSPKLANVLAEETGAKVDVLHSLDGLTQEEMDSGKEYISIMRENLEKLQQALGVSR
ncbi:zinc ABC transporter substrate-binding protein [Irregularibacter muris]|uniref:Zinc ABC transporter substrate-binding protein n=1 Tax=Irregularibacter muris TaxID=1796619 RepID=A0AAE3L0J3_9FIRM|nr:zinc ABC transporter substrate-binding protein [Irregularibacter muris]MCR1900032.1 zinc ABC transporter substrate-binding protein [Irregularibacter muris]